MKILGISAYYHDSAAAFLENGKIIAGAQEERYTRKKNDPSFPSNAIKFCLNKSGYKIQDLDAVVFYDKPFLKFERLLETYCAYAPKGIFSFLKAMPVWLREKLFLKKNIYEELSAIDSFDKSKLLLLFPEHHLSHAASCFYPSPFEDSAIVCIDGVGEWSTATIGHGKGNKITVLKELNFPHSLGLLYSAFTQFCGFKVNSGEYKLMGLAPYGNKFSSSYKEKLNAIRTVLIDIKDDGSLYLNQEYFKYATGLSMIDPGKWAKLFGCKQRNAEAPIEQVYCDIALAIQTVTDDIVLRIAREAKRITGSRNLCMAGGVALNCVSNGKLQDNKLFDQIYIQPAAGDAGGSIGAAFASYHIYFEKPRSAPTFIDNMSGMYLGDEFSDEEILRAVKKFGAVHEELNTMEEVINTTAFQLMEGKVVGWFQGKMEFGPRALGSRSILADPRDPEMQKRINNKIKFREDFRPFAPAVLAEEANKYFDIEQSSPYMLFTRSIKQEKRIAKPEEYDNWSISEKLLFRRSELPAITHIDYSARIQTVHKETNHLFWQLLNQFKLLTGIPVLVNTSFNVRGQPIVRTPEEAYHCFIATGMDVLVMGKYIFFKENQPQSHFIEK
jgi:carbamoyltransferase